MHRSSLHYGIGRGFKLDRQHCHSISCVLCQRIRRNQHLASGIIWGWGDCCCTTPEHIALLKKLAAESFKQPCPQQTRVFFYPHPI